MEDNTFSSSQFSPSGQGASSSWFPTGDLA